MIENQKNNNNLATLLGYTRAKAPTAKDSVELVSAQLYKQHFEKILATVSSMGESSDGSLMGPLNKRNQEVIASVMALQMASTAPLVDARMLLQEDKRFNVPTPEEVKK